MSIKVMSRVWGHSQQKGGELLVMLALADFANDEGECWPSIAVLAQKARFTERQVQYLCLNWSTLESFKSSGATAAEIAAIVTSLPSMKTLKIFH